MDSSSSSSSFFYYFKLSLLVISILYSANTKPVLCCYQTMFAFGDSVTDNGNSMALGLQLVVNPATNPYGMSYFYAPNGRFCNGRIIIDYIAESQGLDYIKPYQAKKCGVSFEQGANFAVGGATVLSKSFYDVRHVEETEGVAYSLEVQVGWFKEHLFSVCNSATACRDYLSTSLIFLGEIGGDDYIHLTESGYSAKEIEASYVPLVIGGISQAIKTLIQLEAKTIFVPGIFPLGCNLQILAEYEGSPKDAYDPRTGCLVWVDDLVQYHNGQLQLELAKFRSIYPNVTISYVDYYNASLPLYISPEKYGFRKDTLYACCGQGGEYNYNSSAVCGPTTPNLCKDPQHYVVWDGIHMTERAYSIVVKAVLSGEAIIPPVKISCSSSQQISCKFGPKKELLFAGM